MRRDKKTANIIKNINKRAWKQCDHRVHKVATAAFWRTFYHEGNISPGW
jgi:hypothetical protein